MLQLRECLTDMCEAHQLATSMNDLRPQDAKFLEKVLLVHQTLALVDVDFGNLMVDP